MNVPAPVLAVDVSLLIFVAIVVISLIKWLFQTIANQQAAPAARPKPPAEDWRRRERLQEEIDQFSREMSGRRRTNDPAIEILPETQRRRPSPPPRARQTSYELTDDDFLPSRSTPGASIAERRLQTNHLGEEVQQHSVILGEGVRRHLQQYMDERVEQTVQQHLGTSGEGRKAAALVMPRAATGLQHKLAALLRDPQSVRQAILLNEILSPPLAQRTKRP
jgi:hypothetical protein